jgi:small subunit ribosomal protein S1
VSNLTTTKKATSMADLMKSVKSDFIAPKKGEALEGTITKLTSSEILVDIGAKTEATVLEKDKRILKSLLSQLKVGDKVTVSVLNPESDFGNSVVSLRRFVDNRIWIELEELKKDKKEIEVTITEVTRGGFTVSSDNGISGFLPNSQTNFSDSQNEIGKKLKVTLIELNREAHKVIFSQKTNLDRKDFEEEVSIFKPEQIIYATITNVTNFGLFVTLQGKKNSLDGFIHLSEIAWERLESVPESYKVGEKVQVKIIGFDKKSGRVNLSIKQLLQDPFQKELEKFTQDKQVTAKIIKILANGIVLDLGESIEGFIKKEKIPPTFSYKEGGTITATVSEVDKNRHRVILVPVLTEKPIGYR